MAAKKLPGRHIGSQFRQTLRQAGYRRVWGPVGRQIILQEIGEHHCEEFWRNDHFAGWVIEVNGIGYEFGGRVPCPKRGTRVQRG